MKRLLSALMIGLLLVSLTACGVTSEVRNTGVLHLKNTFDNSVTEIKVDAERSYIADGDLLAFQSSLSVTEMVEYLTQNNPDCDFIALDDRQILMIDLKGNNNRPYTLFTKCVFDENHNPIDDVFVVRNESGFANQPQHKMVICFPYHLTYTYYTLSQKGEGTYSLTDNLHESFYNLTELKTATHTFTELVKFYENFGGYRVAYEGGDLTGGQICVYPDNKNVFFPEFQILVMKNEDRMAMQYCAGKDVHELKAEEVVENYVDALNSKNTEKYLNCFKEIDNGSVDVFLNSVKSCKLNKSELFWMDQSNDECILKVDRTLISEDGKQMGSLGTGEVYCTDYWLVKIIDGEPKIICQYKSFSDTITELNVYKGFVNNVA